MHISVIDIEEKKAELVDYMDIYKCKISILKDHKDPDKFIESWKLFLAVKQNTLIPIIPLKLPNSIMAALTKKYEMITFYIENNPDNYFAIEDLLFCSMQIEQETLFPSYSEAESSQLNQIYQLQSKQLENEIQELSKVAFYDINIKLEAAEKSIQLFYINEKTQQFMDQTTYITKAKSDAIIDRKLNSYKQLIPLLEKKLDLLLKKVKQLSDHEEIVDTKIDIVALKAEIKAKKGFMKHYEPRKNIF